MSISGAPKREIHVYADPNRLEAYNMSVEQLSSRFHHVQFVPDIVGERVDVVSVFEFESYHRSVLARCGGDMLEVLHRVECENIANPLARIDGVGTVSISGAPKREIHVYADPRSRI